MKFLFPEALWALTALVIPVIIHLFSFRTSRKVFFSDIRWLKVVQQETNKRSRLRHLLVLCLRCLAFAALAVAFAQPYFPSDNDKTATAEAISVFVDNSASMQLNGEEGVNFEQAREAARALAAKARPDDRFQLISQEATINEQRSLSREQFVEQVDAMQPVSTARPLSQLVARQNDWLKEQRNSGRRIWFSDFQQGSADFSNISIDSSLKTTLFQFKPQQVTNLYIDTAWLASPVLLPGKAARVLFRLVNSGQEERTGIRVGLEVNETQKGLTTLDLAAGQSVTDTLDFTLPEAGWQRAALILEDQVVTFDDRYYLAFNIREKLKILVISSGKVNPFVEAIFSGDAYLSADFVQIDQLDYNRMRNYQAVVLDHLTKMPSGMLGAIEASLEQGATILHFPNETMPAVSDPLLVRSGFSAYGKAATVDMTVRSLALADPLFQETFARLPENPDLPAVKKYYPATTQQDAVALLTLPNRDALVSSKNIAAGRFINFHVPLNPEWSNLPQHAIFVPLVYRAVLLGGGVTTLAHRLGTQTPIRLRLQLPAEEVFELTHSSGKYIPELRRQQGTVSIQLNELRQSGWYALHSSKRDSTYAWLAVNSDAAESELSFLSDETLQQEALRLGLDYFVYKDAGITPNLVKASGLNALWKWFLAAVLVFLMAEMLLLKFWK